ncbi:hypothetical protein NPIL_30431 [Nephila pilipes]|uniref:Uncharacterized protein n=1 Tax=Nephila pilipes TaxID=299642 RepID=A0A8X6TAK9_NEPPI|nr:hypothetical protein NPIL_30431 [Nephila pilipes]
MIIPRLRPTALKSPLAGPKTGNEDFCARHERRTFMIDENDSALSKSSGHFASLMTVQKKKEKKRLRFFRKFAELSRKDC